MCIDCSKTQFKRIKGWHINQFIHSFSHSFIHSFIHSFSHSFIHSFIHLQGYRIHFIEKAMEFWINTIIVLSTHSSGSNWVAINENLDLRLQFVFVQSASILGKTEVFGIKTWLLQNLFPIGELSFDGVHAFAFSFAAVGPFHQLQCIVHLGSSRPKSTNTFDLYWL